MTAAIVGELRLQLTGTTLAATRAGRTDNPEAHDLYLRGREHLMQGSEVSIRRAMELFGRAIELDSTYADAYAALGNAWFSLSDVYVAPLEALPHAKEEAARALRLDSSSAEASAVYGFASGLLGAASSQIGGCRAALLVHRVCHPEDASRGAGRRRAAGVAGSVFADGPVLPRMVPLPHATVR
jgi:tetratricopeptide (TPR) repeat protein